MSSPRKEPHQLVGEWLLKMGYSKERFPTEEELRRVCRGSIYRCFWKEVIRTVKPKQEITYIKQNILVNCVKKYEKIQDTSKAKLGQVLPPEPLLLWKNIKEKETLMLQCKGRQEKSEASLRDKILKLKMKSYQVTQMRKALEDKRREVHLTTLLVSQLKKDIEQSKYVVNVLCNVPCLKQKIKETIDNNTEVDVLADFLGGVSLKSPENETENNKNTLHVPKDPYELLFQFKDEDDNINVEAVMENVNISQLFNKLMDKRDEMIDIVVKDNKIEDELKSVEEDARSKSVLPWKESLSQLNLMHCNVVVATLQNKKDLKQLVDEFKQLLLNKIAIAKLPETTLDVVKLKCKYTELNAQISVYKNLHNELFIGNDFIPKHICVNPAMNACLGESIVNVRDEIVSLYSMYASKQSQLHENVNKLTESVSFMKDLRKSFLDYIGHSDYGLFERSDSLNMSFINPNSTFKTSMNKCSTNLIDIKHLFSKVNTVQQLKQDIYDVCKLQQKELKMLKEFDLCRNRKIVLNNGAKLWIDETLHVFQYFDINDQYNLFKFINPMQSTTGICEYLENKIVWLRSLENLSIIIDKQKPKIWPIIDDALSNFDEDLDPRIDVVFKNAKKCEKPLSLVHETITSINKKVSFFKKTNFSKYISDDRTFEGMTYWELEENVKRMLAEEAYWRQ